MSSSKRTLSLNQRLNKNTKRLRNELNQSITSIEDMSNEFFYDVFDYLDSIAIDRAFSHLNYRFQQLLKCLSLLFKIKIDSSQSRQTTMNNYKRSQLNGHQILSIYLWKPSKNSGFFSTFTTGLPLTRLESLVLDTDDSFLLLPILQKLKTFPRLFSLTITHSNDQIDLTDIYRIILFLPVLKYYKLLADKPYLSILLPIATDEQFNTIEHLDIDHRCELEELSMITSYTPKLRRLCFINDIESDDSNARIILPITLSNLTHLYIRDYYKKFDEFEMFISELQSRLKVLSLTTQSFDTAYLDAIRWEEFIRKYLPQLEKFSLQYFEPIDNKYAHSMHSRKLNHFFSSFWIERKWIMEIQIADNHITYLICPYRKKWYESIQDNIDNSSIDFSKFIDLDFTYISTDKIINANCRRVLSATQIYHLNISEEKIYIGKLIQIICSLPKVQSLKIHSLSFDTSRNLSANELVNLLSIPDTCKITKVYLTKMLSIDEVYLLMIICPSMTYLRIDDINHVDIELFLGKILKKIYYKRNHYLRSLCVRVPTADDKMVKTLEGMVNVNKSLLDFTIERIVDNIHLKWTPFY